MIKACRFDRNFLLILFFAFLLRFFSAIFSKGFSMMDDHYIAIEKPQQWVMGYDEEKWLSVFGGKEPTGHSLFFMGLNYFFLKILETIGIYDPQIKMFFIRLIYGLWSLLIIIYGYKITYHYTNKHTALIVAFLLSFYWFAPFLSVRQLVEVHCIPFYLMSIYLLLKKDNKYWILWAGFIGALSFSIRYQSFLIILGILLVLFIEKKFKVLYYYSLGVFLSIFMFQGLIDFFFWNRPFAELHEYVSYNLKHSQDYIKGKPFNYLILIIGMLVPPFSFFIFWGWLRSFKNYLLTFLPALIFLIFHIIFPNRQERFILPIIPLFIINGVIWYHSKTILSSFWQARLNVLKIFVIISFIINTLLLIPLTFSYSKRSYVEAAYYLKDKNLKYFVIDDYNNASVPMLPRFYAGKRIDYFYVSKLLSYKKLEKTINYLKENNMQLPNYVLFLEKENLKLRLDSMQIVLGKLKLDTIIKPSKLDFIMKKLNKKLKYPTIYVYRLIE